MGQRMGVGLVWWLRVLLILLLLGLLCLREVGVVLCWRGSSGGGRIVWLLLLLGCGSVGRGVGSVVLLRVVGRDGREG